MSLRLLVLEGDQALRGRLGEALRSRGHEVVSAASLGAFLQLGPTAPFDAALLSTDLVDGSGLDLLRHAETRERLGEVILLTDDPLYRSSAWYRTQLEELGVRRLLGRPPKTDEMVGEIAHIEDEQQRRRDAAAPQGSPERRESLFRAQLRRKLPGRLRRLEQVVEASLAAGVGSIEGLSEAVPLADRLRDAVAGLGEGELETLLRQLTKNIEALALRRAPLDMAMRRRLRTQLKRASRLVEEASRTEFELTPHRTLLVVGGDSETLRALRETARWLRVAFEACDDPAAALSDALTYQAHGVLLSLLRPRDELFEAARLLSAGPGGRAIPLITLLSALDAEGRMNAAQAQAVASLVPPIELPQLAHSLATLDRIRVRHQRRVVSVGLSDDSNDLIESALQPWNVQVQPLEDGRRIFDLGEAELPDLVVADLLTTGTTGLDVCRMLRADLGLRGVPVVLVSSSDLATLRLAAFEAGADDYVVWPLGLEETQVRLGRLLDMGVGRGTTRGAGAGSGDRRALLRALKNAFTDDDRPVADLSLSFVTIESGQRLARRLGAERHEEAMNTLEAVLRLQFPPDVVVVRWSSDTFALLQVASDIECRLALLSAIQTLERLPLVHTDEGPEMLRFVAGTTSTARLRGGYERLVNLGMQLLIEARNAGDGAIVAG